MGVGSALCSTAASSFDIFFFFLDVVGRWDIVVEKNDVKIEEGRKEKEGRLLAFGLVCLGWGLTKMKPLGVMIPSLDKRCLGLWTTVFNIFCREYHHTPDNNDIINKTPHESDCVKWKKVRYALRRTNTEQYKSNTMVIHHSVKFPFLVIVFLVLVLLSNHCAIYYSPP
jgi:hypothetical protein